MQVFMEELDITEVHASEPPFIFYLFFPWRNKSIEENTRILK